MRPNALLKCQLAAICLAAATVAPRASADHLSEAVVPETTKAYFSIPDLDELREKFGETQIGRLMNDPVMKPFAEDLRRQINEKLTKTGIRLGIELEDLDGVYAGEIAVAFIQPDGDKKQHALALLVDVTGKIKEAEELLAKVDKDMAERKAKKGAIKEGGVDITTYAVPRDMKKVNTYFAIVDNHLVATDHEAVARQLVARIDGKKPGKSLTDVKAYSVAMTKSKAAAGDLRPQIRWFIEPFGYAEVSRAANGGRKGVGKDMLKILQGQGFDAVEGFGGYVNFSTDKHEILHRTYVYAPGIKDLPEDKSARMLDFPNAAMRDELAPQQWVTEKAATYFTFNIDVENAFWSAEGLVDDVVGAKGSFKDVLKALLHDPQGPQIDVAKDLIANLSDRATFLTDYKLPITPQCERWIVAIELEPGKNEKGDSRFDVVKKLVDKAMEHDPDAQERKVGVHRVWEIVPEEEEIPDIIIGGPGGFPLDDEEEEEEGEEGLLLPNSAIVVANNHLFVSSHLDFMREMLERKEDAPTLDAAADFKAVDAALIDLGSAMDSFRIFARTDEAYRPTYELIQQGKMPQAETLMGKLLNGLLAPKEEDELRKQVIDGKKMPHFRVVKEHLGPAGTFIKTEAGEGWYAMGCLLAKEAKVARAKE